VSVARDWDAGTYDRISDAQFAWALEQFERLPLSGSEIALDAGCGSGRVTAVLAERLPRGRVYGVDVSPSMAAHARAALGARATIYCQDLIELSLPEPVDVVFSNATFHWIKDHDALFSALHGAMRPRARLVAQCGGEGNIDAFRRAAAAVARTKPFAEHFRDWRDPWNYRGADETARRLERSGFRDVHTWLEPKRVQPPRTFIETVCLLSHLNQLPERLRHEFVDCVLERTGEPPVLEYVRLNMTARRG
jgi:trans-aconitate 2-methyltransferase